MFIDGKQFGETWFVKYVTEEIRSCYDTTFKIIYIIFYFCFSDYLSNLLEELKCSSSYLPSWLLVSVVTEVSEYKQHKGWLIE